MFSMLYYHPCDQFIVWLNHNICLRVFNLSDLNHGNPGTGLRALSSKRVWRQEPEHSRRWVGTMAGSPPPRHWSARSRFYSSRLSTSSGKLREKGSLGTGWDWGGLLELEYLTGWRGTGPHLGAPGQCPAKGGRSCCWEWERCEGYWKPSFKWWIKDGNPVQRS